MHHSPRSSILLPATLLALGGLLSACSVAPSAPTSPQADAIAWQSCDGLVSQVAALYDVMETPSPLDGWGDRMQCANVSVPLDYDDPDGRQITIAVSRMVPEGRSAGTILTNPGGPGLEGRTTPALLAASGMGDLATDHTLIGIDIRGTGGSTSINCDGSLDVPLPEGTVDERVAVDYSVAVAAANEACVAQDPAYFAQLTTANAARDMDRVRAAIGADQVDYVGVSWGTELGAAYLAQYPDRVRHMLLDSMVDLRHDAAMSLDDLVAADVAYGSDDEAGVADDVVVDGLSSPDSYVPSNLTTRTALTCNAYTGATDPEAVWSAHLARSEAIGSDPQVRTQHPLSGGIAGTSACAGWPIEAHPLVLTSGDAGDKLQIVAHASETVTPAPWGTLAHALLGGNLTILDDAVHGSLANGDNAAEAVEYLRNGTPMS